MDSDHPNPEPSPDQPSSAWSSGPTQKRTFPAKVLALTVAGVAAVAIGAVAWALLALRGTSDVLADMVPGDATVYATAYLDPAAGQKLNVRSLAQKFPELRDLDDLNRRIDELLDEALAESGLTSGDVRPWLGSQVGVAVWLRGTDVPDAAFFVASKDPEAAQAALDKLRSLGEDSGVTWTDREHGGVTISSGSGGSGFYAEDQAYAMVDGTVLLASDREILERIVDTDQGSRERLASTEKFTKAMESLPEEKLGLLYVDVEAVFDQILPAIEAAGDLPLGVGELDALVSVGMVVRAEPDGILAQIATTTDPSKLSGTGRRALEAQPHENLVLSFTPENAYGVIAFSGFRESMEQLVKIGKEDQSASSQLERLGVDEAIETLTGDAGFEASPGGAGGLPAGAFLMGTNDEATMRGFLGNVAELSVAALIDPFSGGGFGGGPPVSEQEEYKGVTITWFSVPDAAAVGVAPAYAVTDGMAIIASSPEEVKDLIDARSGGGTITSAARFQQVMAHADAENTVLFYVDIEVVTAAIRDALSPEEQASFDADVRPNLDPLKAYITTGTSSPERSMVRMFLLIE
ncbi:MAG: DUF3352 domain-containing protein [Actinomycetota bacterium]